MPLQHVPNHSSVEEGLRNYTACSGLALESGSSSSVCLFGISVSKLICYCALPGTDAETGTGLLKTISLKI